MGVQSPSTLATDAWTVCTVSKVVSRIFSSGTSLSFFSKVEDKLVLQHLSTPKIAKDS